MKSDFYAEISRNKSMSVVLMILFSALVIALGYVLGWIFGFTYFGVSIAFIITVVMLVVGYFSGASTVLALNGANPVAKKDDPFYWNTVEGLSIAAGIPMPKLYMIPEESINAFATGRDPQHAVVCVTSGCRKRLSRQEFEGVVAHELGHVKNYDIRIMMLAAVLAGSVVMLADIALRSMFFGGGNRDRGNGGAVVLVFAIVLAILAPIFAQLIKLAVSRQREYLADATGAKMTRYPPGLTSALKKIRDDHDKVVDTANRSTAHLYIENPLRNSKAFLAGMFSTHPPIDERIRRLERM